ncbi:porin [Noviherbaspirillum pedocola]|uniref:Porin n=1 Tax=Noviherbaspirillum pedocola TaxID=2801341 RepID=A0A934W0P5_9BURK|nr:porin [Noviherbaspirillum pedocola]MBK4734336.1 porin [Noviherbaspirillum pedocola]
MTHTKKTNFTPRILALVGLSVASHYAMAAKADIETSFYGFLNGEIESVRATGGATPVSPRGRVTDGNSRVGFSASIGVDAQTRGLLQIEASLNNFDQGGINSRGDSTTLTSRNTYVGIENTRFGRVVVGNNDNAYRSLVGTGNSLGGNLGLTAYGLDVWNNTSAQMAGNQDSIFSRGEARYKNSVHYLSPEWAGFQVAASYGFDEQQSNNSDRGRYSVAGKYRIGGFSVGVGYDHQANTGVDIDALTQGFGFRNAAIQGASTSYTKLLATYQVTPKTTVGAGVEWMDYGFSQTAVPTASNFYATQQNGSMKQRAFMVSVAQEVAPNTMVMASWGKLGSLDSTPFGKSGDFGANQISVGATYKLNDNLMPYIYYTRINNQSQQNVNLGQAPLYSNNNNTSNAFLAPGNSPRAFGIGLIARF